MITPPLGALLVLCFFSFSIVIASGSESISSKRRWRLEIASGCTLAMTIKAKQHKTNTPPLGGVISK
jgi:hypothetical protein